MPGHGHQPHLEDVAKLKVKGHMNRTPDIAYLVDSSHGVGDSSPQNASQFQPLPRNKKGIWGWHPHMVKDCFNPIFRSGSGRDWWRGGAKLLKDAAVETLDQTRRL